MKVYANFISKYILCNMGNRIRKNFLYISIDIIKTCRCKPGVNIHLMKLYLSVYDQLIETIILLSVT